MSDHLTSKQKAERLRELRVLLKSGEYDGADLMEAWIALEDHANLLERPPEATGLQPVRRWNAKYPGISMLEHNGELIRSGFGPYVLAEDYDRVASLLSEAVRMIEGYRRAGFITNPAALEQASDFALRAGNSHHE